MIRIKNNTRLSTTFLVSFPGLHAQLLSFQATKIGPGDLGTIKATLFPDWE